MPARKKSSSQRAGMSARQKRLSNGWHSFMKPSTICCDCSPAARRPRSSFSQAPEKCQESFQVVSQSVMGTRRRRTAMPTRRGRRKERNEE